MKKKYISILLCFLSILILFGCNVKSEPVILYYYYFNACGSCNVGGEFSNTASSILKEIGSSEYQIIEINVFKDSMPESLKLFLKANNLSKNDISYPMLTAGNDYIIGKENIEKGIKELVLSKLNKTSFSFDNKKTNSLNNSAKQDFSNTDKTSVQNKSDSYFVYFYTASCDDCNSAHNFLETLSPNYKINAGGKTITSKLMIDNKNITEQNNLSQLESFFDLYDVPKDKREVPIMFYSKGYISGYKDIKENIEKIISNGEALNFDYNRLSSEKNVSNLTLKNIPGIFLTGLVNGINPCSISMLFLLLSLVVSRKTNVLKIGFSYISGKIAAYFSFGIATYSIISLVDSIAFKNLQYVISIIMVIVSLVLAFLNFRDAYFAKNERYNDIKMQLPSSFRKYNHKVISYFTQKADSGWTIIVIFLLGAIISLGEFLCTGQIYVATIVYLAQNTSKLTGITVFSFIMYVFAVSLPLIVLVILVNKTKKLLVISEYIRKYLPIIKVIFGFTFVLFAILFCISVL